MNDLKATGEHILFKKMKQVEDEKKVSIITPGDINPSLMYGKVISTGHTCNEIYDGEFIYVAKSNAIQLMHLGNEYWIANEDDILVYIEDEVKEETVQPMRKQSGGGEV